MLEQLRKYLNETSLEELKSEWSKIENLGFRGPKVTEYLDFVGNNYKIYLPQFCGPSEVILPENMTSNFSGSFFLLKIAQ